MSLATKAKGYATFICLLAVVAIVGYVVSPVPSKNGHKPDEDMVIVAVKFTPEVRTRQVQISVSENGAEIIRAATKMSPWSQPLAVARGATVLVLAIQDDGERLECFITRNSKVVGHDVLNYGAGAARCHT